MKKWAMIILCMSFSLSGETQGIEDWVSQKATQKKYLLQQIAALKVYIEYVERGYSIAKKGLNTISDIKDDHLNLDRGFFSSLQSINPRVRNYAKVADIIALNISIIQSCKQTMIAARKSDQINANEVEYLNIVFAKLVDGCADLTNELTSILTANKLQLSDGERIKRIDAIYDDMQDRFVFVNSFGTGAKVLSVQRAIETKDVNSIKSLNGIQP